MAAIMRAVGGGDSPFSDVQSDPRPGTVHPGSAPGAADFAHNHGCRRFPSRAFRRYRMIRLVRRAAVSIFFALATALAAGAHAQAPAPDRLAFSTDWLAEAEHGGFYQAKAEGIYKKYGLDVTLKAGGPQVNGLQLLAAGQLDVAMADALQVMAAVEQKVPLVAIAATFQKNPTVIIAHPGVAALADLKGKPIAVSGAANTTFWPWLKQRYGFTDEQKRPYAFSVQPFLVDKALSQQGFATSEPFSIEKGGVKPVVFLLADLGYPPYSEVLVVTRDTLAKRGDVLRRFVLASAEGWKSYLANPAPGNALIRKANPEMSDDLLAYGHAKMNAYAIVAGADTKDAGLLTMTDARWRSTIDFLQSAGLAKPGVDYGQAWTLDVVGKVKVLP
jgi:NitT/TauT family transport system substrate-binding protein